MMRLSFIHPYPKTVAKKRKKKKQKMADGGPRGSFIFFLHGAEQEARAPKCDCPQFG